jgi:hypothetical protein
MPGFVFPLERWKYRDAPREAANGTPTPAQASTNPNLKSKRILRLYFSHFRDAEEPEAQRQDLTYPSSHTPKSRVEESLWAETFLRSTFPDYSRNGRVLPKQRILREVVL